MLALAQHPMYAALIPLIALWVHDTRVVIDTLGQLDEGTHVPQLKGCVDRERLGVLGHSLGGVVRATSR
jgi:hypothetical protein